MRWLKQRKHQSTQKIAKLLIVYFAAHQETLNHQFSAGQTTHSHTFCTCHIKHTHTHNHGVLSIVHLAAPGFKSLAKKMLCSSESVHVFLLFLFFFFYVCAQSLRWINSSLICKICNSTNSLKRMMSWVMRGFTPQVKHKSIYLLQRIPDFWSWSAAVQSFSVFPAPHRPESTHQLITEPCMSLKCAF